MLQKLRLESTWHWLYVLSGAVFRFWGPGLCTAVFASTSVVPGARSALWGCRTTWWQAGPKAEAPVFPPWHCRCSCSDACPQSQPHLGNTGWDYKKILPVPQLSSSVSWIYSLLLFHILEKNDLRWQCHPFQAGTLEMWSTSNTLLGLGLGDSLLGNE